jgi:hypothetical protein
MAAKWSLLKIASWDSRTGAFNSIQTGRRRFLRKGTKVKTATRAVIRALTSFRASRAGAVIGVFLAFLLLGGVAQGQTPGTGTVTIGPPGTRYLLGAGPDGSNIYDSGTVSITVNGYTNYMTYGSGYEPVAIFIQEMVFNINDLNPYVTASVLGTPNDGAGGQILLTARTSGSNTNYPLSVANMWDTSNFSQPSFPATASGPTLTGGADSPVPGYINPKYIVVGVTYAPPGSASSVTYTNSTMVGSSTTISKSFASGVQVVISESGGIPGVIGGKVTATRSTSYTQTQSSSSTITVTKTTSVADKTQGPNNSLVGLDHDYDVIWVWLNPVVFLTFTDINGVPGVQWNGYGFDANDINDLEVVPVTVGWLNGDIPMPSDVAQSLARAWAGAVETFPNGQGPGLTSADLAAILAADPFGRCSPDPSACPTAADLTRFSPSDNTDMPYVQAAVGGLPINQVLTETYTNLSSQTNGTQTQFQEQFGLDLTFGGTPFSDDIKTTTTFTWTSGQNTTITNSTSSTAQASITGPTCTPNSAGNACNPQYIGATEFIVYTDAQFGTFMFLPNHQPNFTITPTPATQSTPVGGGATYTISTTALAGFNGNITLSETTHLPTGVTATFSPNPVAVGSSATLSIATSPQTAATPTPSGSYPLGISGTSSTLTNNSMVTLVVQDFTVAVAPTSQAAPDGGSVNYQVVVTPLQGLNVSNFTASASALPPGASSITGPNSPDPAAGPGAYETTVTVTAGSSTPGGTYTLLINVTVGNITHTQPVDLIVESPSFTLSASPSSQTVTPGGGSTSYTISSSPANGFTGSINLTPTNVPTGVQVTFNPTSISASGSSTMTVGANSSAVAGSYTLTAVGTSGSLTNSTTVTLVVNAAADFSLSATPQAQGINAGSAATYTLSTSSVNGFSGNVNLSATGLPNVTFSPATIPVPGTATMTVPTTSTTAVGNYTITITGASTAGSPTHNASVTLTVNAPPDFSLAITPSSQAIACGCVNYTLSVAPQNGFGGTVTFTIGGLPPGATATGSPTSITGSGSVTLSVCTTSSTPAGAYAITITANSGSISHSATTTLVVTDFSMSASPASQTVTAGSGTSYVVSTVAQNGFNGSVGLVLSGLPSGAAATFSPTSISGAGSSTLAVTTSSSTPAGTYMLTITGANGCRTHSVSVTLILNAAGPATPTISSLSTTAGPVSTKVTVSGANFGASQGSSTVTFNGTVAQPAWGPSSISVPVPMGATTGNVVVTVGAQPSNGVPFSVQDDALHTFAVNCSTCGNQVTNFTIQASPLYGYVIQPGDVMYFYQHQSSGSVAGITLCFSDGDGSCDDNGSTVDQDGKPINADTVQGVTHFRKVSLTPSAGLTLSQITLHSSGLTHAGRWDVYYGDIEIVSPDGTVRPIFVTGSNPSLFASSSAGVTQRGSAIVHSYSW